MAVTVYAHTLVEPCQMKTLDLAVVGYVWLSVELEICL